MGSLGTRDLIRAKANESEVAINLKRGVPADRLEVSRKGSALISVEIFGRAAKGGFRDVNSVDRSIRC